LSTRKKTLKGFYFPPLINQLGLIKCTWFIYMFVLIWSFPTKNKAAYSGIILLIKNRVFTCIMAVYNKKDRVNMCKTSFTHVNTWKTKKCRWLHLIYGIRVSYFWSGCYPKNINFWSLPKNSPKQSQKLDIFSAS